MIQTILHQNPKVTDFKINTRKKDSYELFFVKGKLETVRCTDTCDVDVTVYAAHDGFLGDAQFQVYPSTTEADLIGMVSEAADKALLICNAPYSLPEGETGDYVVPSNFSEFSPEALAAEIAKTVFSANTLENGSLNAVEVFINRYTETVENSRGLHKTQIRYDAMVEAIPTYNGTEQSVELYEQYNFNSLDTDVLYHEIANMMLAVKARYEAVKPTQTIQAPIIFGKVELGMLMNEIVGNLRYSAVYSHAGVFCKGDSIQTEIQGDPITITMHGSVPGSQMSSRFDSDGLSLGEITVVEQGKAVNYFGANRYGQYLGEKPTGKLSCLCLAPGSASEDVFSAGPYLEVVSMSGLQTDFFSDYIGGEVRLAYWHTGDTVIPVTGISISGQLRSVLNSIRLSDKTASWDGYTGPEKAIVTGMKIY